LKSQFKAEQKYKLATLVVHDNFSFTFIKIPLGI
jgi:hypothetical protein